VDHVALNKLALNHYRFCWSTLAASLLLFVCCLFLPINGLGSFAVIAAIGFCPTYCVYRLAGLYPLPEVLTELVVRVAGSP
jgi:hypothetical protein